jgi:prepilin-type N-terminal cleavage/methylation domain-containing protein
VRRITSAALRDERGMTLVELIIVMILVGILILLATTTFRGYRERANNTAAKENIYNVLPAVSGYFVDHSSYTGMTIAGLKATYNAGINPAHYSLGSVPPSDTSYCIQSSSGDRTWRKNGPSADLEPQPCP